MKKLTKKLSILNAYINFSISKVSNFRETEKGVFLDGKRLEKPEIVLNGNGGVYGVEVKI